MDKIILEFLFVTFSQVSLYRRFSRVSLGKVIRNYSDSNYLKCSWEIFHNEVNLFHYFSIFQILKYWNCSLLKISLHFINVLIPFFFSHSHYSFCNYIQSVQVQEISPVSRRNTTPNNDTKNPNIPRLIADYILNSATTIFLVEIR